MSSDYETNKVEIRKHLASTCDTLASLEVALRRAERYTGLLDLQTEKRITKALEALQSVQHDIAKLLLPGDPP